MDIKFDIQVAQVIQLFLAAVLPLVVGLVSTRVTSSKNKALLLLALAFITSLLTEALAAIQAGETFDLGTSLIIGLGTFVLGVGFQMGLWKPVGATDKVLNTGRTSA